MLKLISIIINLKVTLIPGGSNLDKGWQAGRRHDVHVHVLRGLRIPRLTVVGMTWEQCVRDDMENMLGQCIS